MRVIWNNYSLFIIGYDRVELIRYNRSGGVIRVVLGFINIVIIRVKIIKDLGCGFVVGGKIVVLERDL